MAVILSLCSTCVCTCMLLRVKGSNKTSVSIFPEWGEVWEPYFDVVQHTLSSWRQHTFSPWALTAQGSCHFDLTLTVQMYLLRLCLWMCCSCCHPDKIWITLSLTHPLRKGIQVQAHNARPLPGSLSMIKLILWPRTWPPGPLNYQQCEKKDK